MNKRKCAGCPQLKNCRDSFTSWIFFIIGLIATIAVRVVTVLIHLDPLYARIAWYTGVGGFFIFFIYKFRVGQARAGALKQRGLIEKVDSRAPLTDDDYEFISALFCGLQSKKERLNYFFIFILSAIAVLLAVYMDFIRRV